MQYLHIMIDSIYSRDFIKKINTLYDSSQHYFVISQYEGKRKYLFPNVHIYKRDNVVTLADSIVRILKAQNVIFHSLFFNKNQFIAFAFLSYLKNVKFSWYIWSADLYAEHNKFQQSVNPPFQARIKEKLRQIIIGNLHAIIVCAKKDYQYAVKWYSTTARMIQAEYAYNLPEVDLSQIQAPKKNDALRIMVGHNASTTLKHIPAYKCLSVYADKNIEIISFLSYPDNKDYIQTVIESGYSIFREKFHPITNWMNIKDYYKTLNKIDIFILPCYVQAAAGNLSYMLYFGKKVYLSSENALYQKFKEEGIEFFTLEEISDEKNFFAPLSDEVKIHNHVITKNICSDERFVNNWNQVFYG